MTFLLLYPSLLLKRYATRILERVSRRSVTPPDGLQILRFLLQDSFVIQDFTQIGQDRLVERLLPSRKRFTRTSSQLSRGLPDHPLIVESTYLIDHAPLISKWAGIFFGIKIFLCVRVRYILAGTMKRQNQARGRCR